MILPPLEKSINDKIMIFKATQHPMPMPTSTGQEKAAFWQTLLRELPAFVHYLLNDASYVTGVTLAVDGGRHIAI